jgi:predicted metal-dependent hydrolase
VLDLPALMQLNLSFDQSPDQPNPDPRIRNREPRTADHPLGTKNQDPVFVRHPRARRYVVSVRTDGVVRVTIPRRGSLREARAFASKQQPWIERQRQRLELERQAARHVPEALQREAWARAKRELPPRLLGLAADLGLTVMRVSVRNQKWRWGSCSRSGHICLNWRLVDMPDWVRDYVMVHELMHLRRMDHSRRFWKLVAAACPDYERARAWLRANASSPPESWTPVEPAGAVRANSEC